MKIPCFPKSSSPAVVSFHDDIEDELPEIQTAIHRARINNKCDQHQLVKRSKTARACHVYVPSKDIARTLGGFWIP
ncbi:hypothetical protein QYF36_016260 [Acer negundo]|nr:hypothetical protein QYF36_016260 [Acer negundo]